MTEDWIIPNRLFDGDTIRDGVALKLLDGKVAEVVSATNLPRGAAVRKMTGLLTPGFFDIQVNGGGGVLLNDQPTPEALRTIAAAHRGFGTTSILPTVITDRPDVLAAAAEAMISLGHSRAMPGLHIEGPHISKARRGTHAPEFIRPIEASTTRLIQDLIDSGLAVLITVAPEAVAVKDISRLVEMGAKVSLGHSAADAATTQAALVAGATCFTHLFNAMPHMENRAPGIAGAAISSDAWCGIIADGVHVDPLMVAMACRARPVPHRMIAVSDSMATVGGPDTFVLYGQEIRLDGNKLVNAEGSLAGAHLTLAEALSNLIGYGVPEVDALRMCRTNPAELMGLGSMARMVGTPAEELVLLNGDYTVQSIGMSEMASSA